MPVVRRRAPKSVTYRGGPWTEVVTTTSPFDYGNDDLTDAYNVYIPDPENGSGVYARPGFSLFNNATAVTTSATTFRGQGAFSFTSLDGVTSNFVVFNGKLFRSDSVFGVFTDVSPVGITIDAGITTRVFGSTFITQCIVTDGVNRPWLLTNPTSTPVSGAYIDFDGSGTSWAAHGPFVPYSGSVFCILHQVNGVDAHSDIAWSLPGDAAHGWQQTNYDFRWTLEQSAAASSPPPLTALCATETELFYFREGSIGTISGTPGPNLQGQHTDDAISKNIGTLSPQSILQYGTTVFFADQFGRPYRLVPGSDPEPIWKQMRTVIDDTPGVAFPGVTKTVCTAAFEPTLNVAIFAPWSPVPSQSAPAVQGYVFDGRTGKYFGRFNIASGVQLETLAVFLDVNGRGTLVALGSLVPPPAAALATSGYVWGMNAMVATGDSLTTEVAAPSLAYLTTEDGLLILTTEGSDQSGWTDNGAVPQISVSTQRFGYDIDTMLNVDRALALVPSGVNVTVTAATPAVAATAQGTATASTTHDGIGRLEAGFNGVQGRGVIVTLAPTTATSQFFVEQIAVKATVTTGAPDEV